MRFNAMCEADRLRFVVGRDGAEEARAFAKRTIKVYMAASLATRKRKGDNTYAGSRTHPYREKFVEAAYSFRHLLRTNFVEGVSK